MTREEAASILSVFTMDNHEVIAMNEELIEAFRVAVWDLRHFPKRKIPDPDTGLMPCGCGGQGLYEGAYLDEEVPSSYRVCLSCSECGECLLPNMSMSKKQ